MHVAPRVVDFDGQMSAGLVSIASGCNHDFAWETQEGSPADPDLLISADGTRGRLAALITAGSSATFHTHWQSLFSNGSGAGLSALEEVCTRLDRHWGSRIRWTSAMELATYAAAAQSTEAVCDRSSRHFRFHAPIACDNFTIRVPLSPGHHTLRLDGAQLGIVEEAERLAAGTWRRDGDTAVVCFALQDGAEIWWQ